MSFISADSYRGKQEDPLSQNRYTYCHNNPYKYDDPSGHTSLKAQLAQSIFDVDGGATLFGLHDKASGDVEEGVKDLASTAISAAGAMASSGVTANINSTPNTGIILSSSGAATFTPSLIPSYSLSFSTSGSAITIDQSMIFAQTTTGDNGCYNGSNIDNGLKATKSIGNDGSKTIDDIIDDLPETTNGKGVARNFESMGNLGRQ